MTADDKMSINERYQYLRRIQGRYRQATRQAKKAVLDGIVAHTDPAPHRLQILTQKILSIPIRRSSIWRPR